MDDVEAPLVEMGDEVCFGEREKEFEVAGVFKELGRVQEGGLFEESDGFLEVVVVEMLLDSVSCVHRCWLL